VIGRSVRVDIVSRGRTNDRDATAAPKRLTSSIATVPPTMSSQHWALALLLMISGCAVPSETRLGNRSSTGGYHIACLPDQPGNGIVVISRFSLKDAYNGERVIGSVYPTAPDQTGVEAPERHYLGYVTLDSRASPRAYRFVTIHWDVQITPEPSDQMAAPVATQTRRANTTASMPPVVMLADASQACRPALPQSRSSAE
jgi:hypothetical protein